MKTRTFKGKALSAFVMSALLAICSITAFAGEKGLSGEIVITGANDATVMVNGEAVKSGRTVFSNSVISTPADTFAVVSVKNVGKIKVGPSTSMRINFAGEDIKGSIESGQVTVLNAKNAVEMTAPNGKVAKLVNGASVVTNQDDDSDDDKGTSWLLWFIVFGGAAAAVAIAAASNNNSVDLGGGTTVVSPNI